MTSASLRTLYGKTDYTQESRFLREMDKSLLVGDPVYEKKKERSGGVTWADGYSSATIFKPFEKAQDQASRNFSPGDRVNHAKFGDGLVVEADSRIIGVMFDAAGYKKLAKDVAPIKIVEKAD